MAPFWRSPIRIRIQETKIMLSKFGVKFTGMRLKKNCFRIRTDCSKQCIIQILKYGKLGTILISKEKRKYGIPYITLNENIEVALFRSVLYRYRYMKKIVPLNYNLVTPCLIL
jgi:hypothetical protein